MSGSAIPQYPWKEGDHLYASALNAAFADGATIGGPYIQTSGGTMIGDIAPYFGTVNTGVLIDLITTQPANGIYQTAGASNIQAEPILGPFMGKDFTRAQSVSYLTTTLGSDVGEYAHLYNLRAETGYPGAWAAYTAYLLHDTVINGGNFYSVTTAGTSAATGGPTGTGAAIADGTVVWAYQAGFQATNGGKVNLGLFTYADANAGHTWGIANDLQIAAGTNKVAAYAYEIDINNYRMDYNTGIPGPAAVALQIFAGGPHRSSYAIAIGAQGTPTDPANFVYGMIMQGAQLVSNIDVWLSTGANVGLQIDNTRTGTNSCAIYCADTSSNAIIIGGSHANNGIWVNDNAPTGLQVSGTRTGANSTAIYCADTSSTAIIIGGSHGGQDIWVLDNSPTVLRVQGTHSSAIDVTAATFSGAAWWGPLSVSDIVSVGAGQATINSGIGAPSATRPVGSIYMRTDGSAGARLYVSAGGGTWTAVAGV